MDIYGYQNTDMDRLYDILDNIFKRIVEDIRETFKLDSVDSLYDDMGEGNIVGNIDILLTLCYHYKAHPTLTNSEEILRWKQDYLATYDRIIKSTRVSAEFAKKRRDVIAETFDKLYEWVDEMNI